MPNSSPTHRSGLSTAQPVLDRLAFKSFVKFPALSDRCLFHGCSFILYPILCPSIRSNLTRLALNVEGRVGTRICGMDEACAHQDESPKKVSV